MKKIIKGVCIFMMLFGTITNSSCSNDRPISKSLNDENSGTMQINKSDLENDTKQKKTEEVLNLSLDKFDFLKLGMSISQVENVVGKAHFQTGSGFLKDAYNLVDDSYIELNYGPGLDALRSAKVIYKDGTVKNMTLK